MSEPGGGLDTVAEALGFPPVRFADCTGLAGGAACAGLSASTVKTKRTKYMYKIIKYRTAQPVKLNNKNLTVNRQTNPN